MERTLTAIFCDDVRQEVGNKLSYIGCYTGEMVVPQSPISLPKFCVVLVAYTSASDPFKQLKFRLLKNDEVMAEADVPSADLLAAPPPKTNDGEEVRQSVMQVIQIFPLQIDAPCKYRARAITESGELRGGTLVVSLPVGTAPT